MKKQIVRVSDGKVFDSVRHLSIYLNIYEEFILQHLRGKRKTVGGEVFSYKKS